MLLFVLGLWFAPRQKQRSRDFTILTAMEWLRFWNEYSGLGAGPRSELIAVSGNLNTRHKSWLPFFTNVTTTTVTEGCAPA